MYGQMTAGLVDLHRHAGNPAGHLRDLRRVRPAALRRHARGPAGRDRRPGRHGRRPAAGRHDERRRLPRRGRGRDAHPAPGRDRLLRPAGAPISTRRCAWSRRRARAGGRSRSGWSGNIAEVLPELVRRGVVPDVVTDQTSAHDLRLGYIPAGLSLDAGGRAAGARTRRATRAGCSTRWWCTSRRCSSSRRGARWPSTTATTCAGRWPTAAA